LIFMGLNMDQERFQFIPGVICDLRCAKHTGDPTKGSLARSG